jgi:tetratricopeptide (TPR) repeat protein
LRSKEFAKADATLTKLKELLGPNADQSSIDRMLVSAKSGQATVFSRSGQYTDAIEILKETLAFDSAKPYIHLQLGRAYQNVGDVSRGRESLNAALQALPSKLKENPVTIARHDEVAISSAFVHRARISLESELGDPQSEKDAWQDLVHLLEENPTPDSGVHWGYLGQGLYRVGRYEESVAALERVIELRDETQPSIQDGPRWWYLAMALAKTGKQQMAQKIYDNLVEQLGDSPNEAQQRFRDELADLLGLVDMVKGESK